jgi:ABC-type branched-subunit amino acid transport system ATPase component
MLAMGCALMAEPRLLLIDELSLGLMPKMVDQCFAALAALKRNGLTILLVEQNTARARGGGSRLYPVVGGRRLPGHRGAGARDEPLRCVSRYSGGVNSKNLRHCETRSVEATQG